MNIAFSVDSILVAVAISPKKWVVLTGGLLGIVAMRIVISQLLSIVRRYPTLVDGAFVIIALVGLKLLLEYAHAMEWVHFEVPKWLSLGLIAVTFLVAYLLARRKGPVEDDRRTRPRRHCSRTKRRGQSTDHRSVSSSVFVSPSSRLNFVALAFSRSSTSGSPHSPCAMYSTAIA